MFTEYFNDIIQKRDITPYKIAKATGISQGLMGEYKKGIKVPTADNLVKIADYLDCSVDYLLGRNTAQTDQKATSVQPITDKQVIDHIYDELSKEGKDYLLLQAQIALEHYKQAAELDRQKEA